MRVIRFLIFYAVVTIFGVTLIAFLAQNRRTVRLDLFGPEYTINLAWVLLGAAVFGALAALVLLLPGRIALTVLAWRLERELRQLDQEFWSLREQRERLLARHDHALEAHEHLLLTYQRLVDEYNRLLAERERARSQAALLRVASGSSTAGARRAQEPTMLPRVAVISPASQASSASSASPVSPASRTSQLSADPEDLAALPEAPAVQHAQPAAPALQQARLVPVTLPPTGNDRAAPNKEPSAATREDTPRSEPEQKAVETDLPVPRAEARQFVEVGLAPVVAGAAGAALTREGPSPIAGLSARLRETSAAGVAFVAANSTALRGKVAAQLTRLKQRHPVARPAVSLRSPGASVSEEASHDRWQADGIEDPAYRQ